MQDELRLALLAALKPISECAAGSLRSFRVHTGTVVGKGLRWITYNNLDNQRRPLIMLAANTLLQRNGFRLTRRNWTDSGVIMK